MGKNWLFFLCLVGLFSGCARQRSGTDMKQSIESMLTKQQVDEYAYFVTNKERILVEKQGISQDLAQVAEISLAFDRANPIGYYDVGDPIPDVFPGSTIKNKDSLAVWNVFRINNQTVLWHIFSAGEASGLLLKSVEKGITVGIAAANTKTGRLFERPEEDLLNIPVAVAVLKTLFVENAGTIDYSADASKIRQQLENNKNTAYCPLFTKELAFHISMAEKAKDTEKAADLRRIYSELFPGALPVSYITKQPIAQINYVRNNTKTDRSFSIEQDTIVYIHASGQTTYYSEGNYANQSDHIRIALGPQKKGERLYNYQFHYGNDQVEGFSRKGASSAEFSAKQIRDTIYQWKITIPWETVCEKAPEINDRFRFNISYFDSDLEELKAKSVLSWFLLPTDPTDNKREGELILSGTVGKSDGKTIFSRKIADGISIEEAWLSAPSIPLAHCIRGKIDSDRDNSVRFRSLWSKSGLFFRAEVTDNVMNHYGMIVPDKYWIENVDTGEIIQRFTGNFASFCFPVSVSSGFVFLPKGNYRLHYTSDNKHSFEYWYNPIPPIENYGVKIFIP